jgi:hypothetical protein
VKVIGWWLAAALYLIGIGALVRFFGVAALRRVLIWGIILSWPVSLSLFLVHDTYWVLREWRTIKQSP